MLIYTRDVVPASFKSEVYTVMLNKFSAKKQNCEDDESHIFAVSYPKMLLVNSGLKRTAWSSYFHPTRGAYGISGDNQAGEWSQKNTFGKWNIPTLSSSQRYIIKSYLTLIQKWSSLYLQFIQCFYFSKNIFLGCTMSVNIKGGESFVWARGLFGVDTQMWFHLKTQPSDAFFAYSPY